MSISAAAGEPPEYTILVPTYNECENISLFVHLVWKVLRELVAFEVIVVDDNSPDGTQEAVRELQRHHPATVRLLTRPAKLGLGSAYMEGLQHARGKYVILMDADLSHHPKHLRDFISTQRSTGADIVTGTRYLAPGGVAGWNWVRKLTSRGANLLASFLLGASTSDLTGAYRLYKRDCLLQLMGSTASKGYAFQMEVIVRAQYAGMHIEEVPIVFVDRLYGKSKLGPGEYVMFIQGLLRLLRTL